MSDIYLPLKGHGDVEADITSALNTGRFHHAWLLEGPSGIGKARLARRLAARLLGAAPLRADSLDSDVSDPVVQALESHGHPDFRLLVRETDDKGKQKQVISVDQIRDDLVRFLELRPALGGRRVCILDSLDELNANGANALLKSLEEPPPNCVIILIHHGQRSLLPTVRSRCRRQILSRLNSDDMEAVLQGLDTQIAPKVRELADGRPGLARAYADAAVGEAIEAAYRFAESLTGGQRIDLARTQKCASQSDTTLAAFRDALMAWAANKEYANAWLWMSRQRDHALRDAMDRGQTTANLISGLQQQLEVA